MFVSYSKPSIRRMLCCLIYVCLSVAFSQAQSPSLTGVWVYANERPDGGLTDKVFYNLEQHGETLTGKVVYRFAPMEVTQGKVTGDHFHFVAVWTPKFVFDGQLAGDELRFSVSEWDGKPSPRIARRATREEIEKEMNPPARLPLPANMNVPPNGLAATPPMGWNSWNKFGSGVDDKLVRRTADIISSSGMRDAGYVYINIDDTWEGLRDSHGELQANGKFPDMKALADYVHSKGLKLGIYSSPGPYTCGGYVGSFGHEEQDAATFARWGIDYLKYDWCSAGRIYESKDMPGVYAKMGFALRKSGRPIVYSLCQYGVENPWKWAASVGGNLWRTTDDISDSWPSMSKIGFSQSDIGSYAGAGHWNDPDMLEVGNGGMSDDEYRTHMSLWSMLSAPLLAGNDLAAMTDATRAILLNREVIALDQDSLGVQGHRLRQEGGQEVWVKPLAKGAVAVALFNRDNKPARMIVTARELNVSEHAAVRDLWKHAATHFEDGTLSAEVPAHGVAIFRIQPK